MGFKLSAYHAATRELTVADPISPDARITFSYYPTKIDTFDFGDEDKESADEAGAIQTAEQAEKAAEKTKAFANRVILHFASDWDFLDEDDTPFPLSGKSLDKLPVFVRILMFQAIFSEIKELREGPKVEQTSIAAG